MQRFYNVLLCFTLTFLGFATYAQALEPSPVFGSEISELSWHTWKWVFLFCFLGSTVRLLLDLKGGKMRARIRDRLIDTLIIFTVGFAAGFLIFVVCEYINHLNGKRYIPDLAICGLMFASAINNEIVLQWVAVKLKSALGALPTPSSTSEK